MGALHPSIDPALVRVLRRSLSLDWLVESLAPGRPSAASAIAGFQHVRALDAATEPGSQDASILYWLDSHWSDEPGHPPSGPCPIPGELERIGALNPRSVLVLDDARLFLTTPARGETLDHWPGMAELSARLMALGPDHRLWVINDMVILAPATVARQMADYHRKSGMNLSRIMGLARTGSRQQAIRDHVEAQRTKGRAGFNVAFQTEARPETILAFHLKQMGIGRILDIGANRGQFGKAMRRHGYGGEILSVEPQAEAHQALLAASRDDGNWCVLPRQATGARRGFVDLNIAANSVSSSVRTVHPNHVRADRSTTQIRRERVFISRSGDLLHSSLMSGIEAVKIDVQGFEDQVLEGFRPWLGQVRLLQVELSLVECYEGGPDMFSLDRQIVEDFGFRRVSLEPTYYDDVTGVVQQYDGIYFRPDLARPAPAPTARIEVCRITDLSAALRSASPGCCLVLTTGQVPKPLEQPSRQDWVLAGQGAMRLPPDLVTALKDRTDLIEGLSLDRPGWDIALCLIATSWGYGVKATDFIPETEARTDVAALRTLIMQLAAEPEGHAPGLMMSLQTEADDLDRIRLALGGT